jgi:HAD domain in Swiss Army Knife RNA repair proteins
MRGTGELILYLDFDGVLHHENCLWHPKIGAYLSAPEGYVLFQHSVLLDQLLTPYPHVKIVLSTSWVRRYGCSKAAKNLRPGLRSRVIGATYHSNMREHEFAALPRGLQVWSDVIKRKPRDWLALDDVTEGWPEQALSHFVRAHELDGISDPAVLVEFQEKLGRMCR